MTNWKISLLLLGFLLNTTLFGQAKELNELTSTYFSIKNALVTDDAVAAKASAERFVEQIQLVAKTHLSSAQEKAWNEHKGKLSATATAIVQSPDIGKQREQLNELSNALFAVLKVFGVNEKAVYYQYCPMKKAYWLSNEKEIRNPYYGKKMLTCGSVRETLK